MVVVDTEGGYIHDVDEPEPEPEPELKPEPEPTILVIDTHTPSMDFDDDELRIHLIDNFYLRYDVPIIPYWDLALTTNWSNLKQRVAFIEALKKEIVYLYTQSNGKVNLREKARLKAIILNIAELEQVYEDDPTFIPERIKETVRETIEGLSLYSKIGVGLSVAGAVIFGSFIGYNFLKSYGTEKGKLKARGK